MTKGKKPTKFLLIGLGGREHELACEIAKSKYCEKLFIAPGNVGTGERGTNVPLHGTTPGERLKEIGELCLRENIEVVVVGPEELLCHGISDYFDKHENLKSIRVFGPDAEGASLEGSKTFAKEFMEKHSIPTAHSKSFTAYSKALRYIQGKTMEFPLVIKADGLALGKGVVVAKNLEEATDTLEGFMRNEVLGTAGKKVVIEQFLDGTELSVFVVTDGKDYIILPTAMDYKRLSDDDEGPNTGGMGAISPAPAADADFMKVVEEKVIIPTMEGLKKDGINYKGVLYFGLMRVEDEPYVLEYNCRFGEPEAQVVCPRITSDFTEMILAVVDGTLGEYELTLSDKVAACITIASAGYPGRVVTGEEISFNVEIVDLDHCVFIGGAKKEGEKLVTSGGRVAYLCASGDTMEDAIKEAYAMIPGFTFKGAHYRTDIGKTKEVFAEA